MSDIGFEVCSELVTAISSDDLPLVYVPKYREFGITYLDGGSSYQLVVFCPFCRERLPGSFRDEWFDALERLGLEPEDPGVPEEYAADTWWRP